MVKKFGDDQAGQYASLLAYYAFLATFPLILVAVSVLGLALRSNPELQKRVLDSGLAEFPVLGDQLRANIHSLDRSGIDLGEACERVLRLPAVADKTFLVTIGDRTVGGLIARDQMVGPWQVPVADAAAAPPSAARGYRDAWGRGTILRSARARRGGSAS